MISAPPPGSLPASATDPSGSSIWKPVPGTQDNPLLQLGPEGAVVGSRPVPGTADRNSFWNYNQVAPYNPPGVADDRITPAGDVARMAQQIRPVADQKPASEVRDNPEDMFTPQQNLERNKAWAKPGPYNTPLPPQEERQFQKWVKDNNVNWNNNDLSYDMRGYWKAMKAGDPEAKTTINDYDKSVHYPDRWKTPYEATFSNESQYAQPTAPQWVKIGKDSEGKEMWQYRLPNGHVIYDDKQGRWFGLPSSSK